MLMRFGKVYLISFKIGRENQSYYISCLWWDSEKCSYFVKNSSFNSSDFFRLKYIIKNNLLGGDILSYLKACRYFVTDFHSSSYWEFMNYLEVDFYYNDEELSNDIRK